MNLLGKIFVVMIVVMSLVFLGLAMAVYSAHRNWPAEVAGLRQQVTNTRAELEQQVSRYQQDAENLQLEKDTAEQQIRKLESERVALVSRLEDTQTEVNQLKQQNRDATTAVAATQQVNQKIAEENQVLQQNIIATQEAADRAFDQTVQATGELHEATIQVQNLIERNQQLTEQTADMTRAMVNAGLDPATPSEDITPKVEGFISGISRRAGSQLIEITVGYDAGIRRNHTVEIFRGDRYIGRAEVLDTSPNRATARVIPEQTQYSIQEGDSVATRLSLR